jgi:hypothetical protein
MNIGNAYVLTILATVIKGEFINIVGWIDAMLISQCLRLD